MLKHLFKVKKVASSVTHPLPQKKVFTPTTFYKNKMFYQLPVRSIQVQSFYLNNLAKNANIPTELNTIRDNKGANRKIKRVGRGPGSGLGKTCGKGHKGKRARSYAVKVGFEGGQYPLYKRIQKHGFKNMLFKRDYQPVSLARLQFWIDTGRIDPTQKITMKTLVDTGCCGRLRKGQVGIKLLGEGAEWFNTPIDIEISQASSSTINAIKRTGGDIKLVYYNRVGLRALLKPEKFEGREIPYLARPKVKVNKKLVNPMEQPEQLNPNHRVVA